MLKSFYSRAVETRTVLSKKGDEAFFNVENTIIISEFTGHVPNYVFQTLALGPRHPVMTKFDEKEVLIELDSFLNFCGKKFNSLIPDSTLTEVNIKTLHYIGVGGIRDCLTK